MISVLIRPRQASRGDRNRLTADPRTVTAAGLTMTSQPGSGCDGPAILMQNRLTGPCRGFAAAASRGASSR